MRLLSIDYGEKRVGIAVTDESGEFALPKAVVENKENLLKEITNLISECNIEKVILGESKNLNGEDNPIMEDILNLKKELESMGVKVILHPEVYTSAEAERIQGKNEMLDASAAALILKSYIDSNKNANPSASSG